KKYELKERAAIVKMLGMSLNDLDEDQVIEVRIAFVDNLALICNRQECPRKYKGSKLEKQQPEHLSAVHKLYKNETIETVQQIQGPDLTCDLCKSDEEAGPAKKGMEFKRIDILPYGRLNALADQKTSSARDIFSRTWAYGFQY
ncbi:hypothetical protein V493_00742, partial [Pseudogymnoascus sp. VKM F-4281 (FW-2241)]